MGVCVTVSVGMCVCSLEGLGSHLLDPRSYFASAADTFFANQHRIESVTGDGAALINPLMFWCGWSHKVISPALSIFTRSQSLNSSPISTSLPASLAHPYSRLTPLGGVVGCGRRPSKSPASDSALDESIRWAEIFGARESDRHGPVTRRH